MRPLVDGAASLVIDNTGTPTVGDWGRDVTMNPTVASVRQNLSLIVDSGALLNVTQPGGLVGNDATLNGAIYDIQGTLQYSGPEIPKIGTGLLAHRKAGRWLNTQENSFILLALDRYFQTYEKTTPDFVARVWLGDDYAGDHPFKGRQTDYYQLAIPMKDVATHDKAPLTIEKDGIDQYPRLFAACKEVSIRGWHVPGFWPTTKMASANWKSSSVTVPLPTPMVSVSARPDDSWHMFEQSGRLFVPNWRTKS